MFEWELSRLSRIVSAKKEYLYHSHKHLVRKQGRQLELVRSLLASFPCGYSAEEAIPTSIRAAKSTNK